MKKIIIICGLISGLVVSVIMAISMITCYNNPDAMTGNGSMIIGYLSMLIAFSMIFVGVKNFRDKQNGGLISFGKAFKIGFFISLIASTMYVIVWAIVYNFFVPDFMEKYTAHILKEASASANAIQLQEKTAETKMYKEMYKNPLFFVLLTYAEILPVGIIVSLISAFILKRRNRKEAFVAA